MQPRQPTKGNPGIPGLQAPSVPPYSSHPPIDPRRGSPLPLQPVGAPVPAAGPMQMTNQYVRTPIIRYSSRMRVGRIHPLRATLSANGAPALGFQPATNTFDPPVVIQVTVPGAVVTPPHVIVPLSGGDANFYVQPLMAGRLVGGKVEFLSQGRKIGEVALPMKANRGRLARWLFFFAILLPFVINFFPDLAFTDRSHPAPAAPSAPPPREKQKPFPASTGPDEFFTDAGAPIWTITTQPPKPVPTRNAQSQKDSKAEKPAKNEQEGAGTRMKDNTRRPTEPKLQVAPPSKDAADVPSDPAGKPVWANFAYRDEDAIWAWIRSKLHEHHYQTKIIAGGGDDLFTVSRRYEITAESNDDWTTPRLVTVGLYHAEPVLRYLYRFLIAFPRSWPFGDLIYCFSFLSLATLVWLATNPNRRTLKGPVMNIHVGS